jgi:quercetin dioxygenase-like cupin family protein
VDSPLVAGDFVIVEWTAPAGDPRPIAPLHLHREDDEAWYVLEGTLGFRLGEEEIEAQPGSAVLATRGVPHTYWNAGAGAARYLLVLTPQIHALIEAIHATDDRSPETMRRLFAEHASALV